MTTRSNYLSDITSDLAIRAYSGISQTPDEREINPDKRPIKTSDADAADRLADKITKLEARQDAMRRANAIIRAHNGATAESLASLLIDAGLAESEATKVTRPNCYGAIGYMSFELRNNLAEIRRLRGRLTKIERLQSLSPESQEADGLRVVYNPQINRVQLFFAAKPTYDERAALKRNGYRWSPRIGAWQAYYNRQSREYAQGLILSITQSA